MKTLRNLISVSALGATAVAGAIVGSQLLGVADARVSSTDTNDATTTAAQTGEKSDATGAADAGARTDDRSTRATETALTGEQLTKATAAATAAQPGATVERAETDADGDAFEVHMTAADGSRITVKLDENFAVTSTETGEARGRHPDSDKADSDKADSDNADSDKADADSNKADSGSDGTDEGGAAS